MKIILSFFLWTLVIFPVFSQCNPFYNLSEGAEYEVTNFNPKGKLISKVVTKVISVDNSGGETVATVEGTIYDKKNKEVNHLQYQYKCSDGNLMIDMKTLIPMESIGNNPDIKFEMSGDYLQIPSRLQVGDILKDGTITGKMVMGQEGPVSAMDMTVSVKNRRVESKEDVTTPAGSFSCYKISYELSSSTEMMGMMNISHESSGIDFLAENVGVVRSEAYNKNGKLSAYSELTSYK